MSTQPKLSLFAAILININIMMGSGIFINTVVLSKQAGSLGSAVYVLVGILLLPLILAIAQLLKYHPNGGTVYHFGASVHPYMGFISGWSYFTAKLASCGLGVHVCISFLQEMIPALKAIPILGLDTFVILAFAALNMLNLRLGQTIQYCFMGLKLVPILFAIIVGIFLFSGGNFSSNTFLWTGVPTSIPLVLYAFSGFEASCSLSAYIENSERNGPRAILISYLLVISIVTLYQTMFFGALGMQLSALPDYRQAFPALLSIYLPASSVVKNILITLLHFGIASSSLGASYGILYSNSWNLYALAQNKHIFGHTILTKLNKHAIAYMCVVVEAILAIAYLLLAWGQQIPLQQVSAFGATVTYTLSAFALLIIVYRRHRKISLTALCSIASCSLLIGSFVWSIARNGIATLLVLFLGLLALGSFMFYTQRPNISNEV